MEGSATKGGVYNKDTHTVTWVIQNVAAKADGEVSFKTTVNEKAVEVINNVASIQAGNNPEISVDTDTVETEVLVPEIEMTKKQALGDGEATSSQIQVKTGDKVTYYITVSNKGNLEATDVIVSDTIPAGMAVIENSISNKGALKDGTITWTVDELKANESITVSFSVNITETEAGAKLKNVALSTHGNDPINPKIPEKTNEVILEYTVASAPKTGDSTSVAMWSTLTFASIMVCGALLVIEKKRKGEI